MLALTLARWPGLRVGAAAVRVASVLPATLVRGPVGPLEMHGHELMMGGSSRWPVAPRGRSWGDVPAGFVTRGLAPKPCGSEFGVYLPRRALRRPVGPYGPEGWRWRADPQGAAMTAVSAPVMMSLASPTYLFALSALAAGIVVLPAPPQTGGTGP